MKNKLLTVIIISQLAAAALVAVAVKHDMTYMLYAAGGLAVAVVAFAFALAGH